MMSKEEIEKIIFENPAYKNALKSMPEDQQALIIEEIKKIVEGFHTNVLIPFDRWSSE